MTTQSIITPDELIPVFTANIDGHPVQACDARALHTFIESKWQFADWIKNRIEKYGFEQNQDFIFASVITEAKNEGRGGHNRVEYYLTLDMAKELAMVENNAKGREVRRYFIKMERIALVTTKTPSSFTNLAAVTRAWADTARSQANVAQAIAEECERHLALDAAQQRALPSPVPPLVEPQPNPISVPNKTHDRESGFLTSMWDCLGSRHVTAGDLYRIIISRQCLGLSNAAVALFGDIELWTAKKLVISLRSWSEHPITGYVLLAVNRSKHGILWRLERTG